MLQTSGSFLSMALRPSRASSGLALAAWLALVAALSLFVGCSNAQTTASRPQFPARSSEQAATQAVRNLAQVIELPPKRGEAFVDPYAVAVLKLGKAAAPRLVDAIIDTTPTRTASLFQYTVGDVAIVLLSELYQTSTWPYPTSTGEVPRHTGDFRDYVEFMSRAESRLHLQAAWRQFVASH